MSKRLFLVLFLTMLILLLAIILITIMINNQEKLFLSIETITDINYNNYIFDNEVDYKGNQLAWLQSHWWRTQLIVLDDKDQYHYFNDIDAPFQLYQSHVVFLKNNKLYLKDLNAKKDTELVTGVNKFIVYQDYIIYDSVQSFDEDMGQWTNELYLYNILSKNQTIIYQDLKQFYIYKDKLFAINNEDELVEISFQNYAAQKIVQLQVKQYPFCVMPQGDRVLYLQCNQLNVVDLCTGDTKTVSITDDPYINNKVNYICDDSNIFLSFQATKTNGSIVINTNDEHNGLWAINPQTLEKEKICSDVFERLYLFDRAWLLGVKQNSLYKIDVRKKQVIKISD